MPSKMIENGEGLTPSPNLSRVFDKLNKPMPRFARDMGCFNCSVFQALIARRSSSRALLCRSLVAP